MTHVVGGGDWRLSPCAPPHFNRSDIDPRIKAPDSLRSHVLSYFLPWLWHDEENRTYASYYIILFYLKGWQLFITSNVFISIILSNTHIFHIILIKGQKKSRRIHWVRSNWKQINCLYIHSPYVQVQVVTMVNSIPFRIYHTSTDWCNPIQYRAVTVTEYGYECMIDSVTYRVL